MKEQHLVYPLHQDKNTQVLHGRFWEGECPFSAIPEGLQNHRKDKVRRDHYMSSIPTPWHGQGPLGHIT